MASQAELSILIKMKDEATSQLKNLGKAFAGITGVVAGFGTAAATMAAGFESKMREVNTMLGLSEDQFASLSSQVNDLSTEVGISGNELASALYQAISAGVPAADAITMLRTSAQAAVGGVTDVTTSVDGLTTVLNAFKIPASDAEKVADIMFTTVKGGKTTMEELSASMFQVAPLAASAGVKFEEVAGAIATVTKQGVPTSVATTQLRAAIQAIIKPTADMKSAMESLGIESGTTLIQEKGLAGALNTLVEAADGNQEVLGRMFGSVEGLGAVLSLTGDNAKTFEADLASMSNSAGASMAAYDEINKGTARTFEQLKVQVEALMVELGSALLPAVKPLITAFSDLVAALPIEQISQLLNSLLPPLAEVLLKVLNAIPIDAFIAFVMDALTPLLDILTPILDAFTPILEVLGDIVKAIPIKEFMELVTGVLKPLLIPVLQSVVNLLKSLTPILETVFNVLGAVMKLLTPILEGIAKVAGFVTSGVGGVIGNVVGGIGNFLGNILPFAEGGIVTKPTLALIGEAGPEAIVPLGQPFGTLNSANGSIPGTSQTNEYTFNLNFDGVVVREEQDIKRLSVAVAENVQKMFRQNIRTAGA
ncbi:phage tail tape measure protein [Dehalococcoides sp.]|jgi:TP901 family phage tail tape measure protein|uniref:phage tail tape measure protein n=1 Tax=Dehalococcoides sp. TaxID=1966486 RepID=UPI0035674017